MSCLTKAEEPSLPYYLPIAGGRIIGLIPFPRVLVQCEMQSVSCRIWIRVAVSVSYDDNHYTSIIRYVSRVKWSSPGKGVVPSPTPRCSSYWKRSFLVALDYGRQLYFIWTCIYIYIYSEREIYSHPSISVDSIW